MIRKLFIVAWFGPLPDWMPHYRQNIRSLEPLGYDWLFFHDLEEFAWRCTRRLGVGCPIREGGTKVHDYRPVFGSLFRDEIAGYDFWGHTDLDCVYGRVDSWVTDEFLDGCDLHSNAPTCVCGPWALYRNNPRTRSLFKRDKNWKRRLEAKSTSGWVEKSFSVNAEKELGERFRRTNWQTEDLNGFVTLRWEQDRLVEHGSEVMMGHFRRTKEYPPGCLGTSSQPTQEETT